MSIFADMSNSEKLEVASTMLVGLRREIYRMALLNNLDPETFDPAAYPDPETLNIDPTQYFRVNYSDMVLLHQTCQRYVALEARIAELS